MTSQAYQRLLSDSLITLIWRNSFPMIGAILALFSYDLLESSLMALSDANTLTALGFTLPITTAMTAFAIATSISCNNTAVKSACQQGKCLSLAISRSLVKANVAIIIFTLLLLACSGLLLNLLGNSSWLSSLAPEQQALFLSEQSSYLNTRYLGWVFLAIIWQSNGILRAIGLTHIASKLMISWITVKAFLAIILLSPDSSYFISSMYGASLTHAISDFTFALASIAVLHHKIKLKKPSLTELKETEDKAKTTSSLIVMQQLITPISIGVITIIALSVEPSLVAAFAIIFRIEALLLLLPMVLTTSMPAIVGINYWSGHQQRANQAIMIAFITIMIMQACISIILLNQENLLSVWICPQDEVSKHLENYLMWLPWGYLGTGCALVYQSCLNAKGKVLQATILAVSHRIILLLPLAFIGVQIDINIGIFQGLMLGHLGAGILSLLLFYKHLQKKGANKAMAIQAKSS
ncbi:MATE family efflux transporter [Litorilituus sediminis]|uniref:MATE family efflux transporter n=1 Tax=Litorilituus sediminis TaxID=718192 RepID=A0A4P6P7M6_9GAMM|nr:MATE family efflux transporter [Litorilituus sediminis]QBG37641.1 hypothetical protein EMK97_18860 [Litorilituus sediminis]